MQSSMTGKRSCWGWMWYDKHGALWCPLMSLGGRLSALILTTNPLSYKSNQASSASNSSIMFSVLGSHIFTHLMWFLKGSAAAVHDNIQVARRVQEELVSHDMFRGDGSQCRDLCCAGWIWMIKYKLLRFSSSRKSCVLWATSDGWASCGVRR